MMHQKTDSDRVTKGKISIENTNKKDHLLETAYLHS